MMSIRKLFSGLTQLFFVLLLIGCTSPYEKMKQRELARNIRYDTLFLGLKFGMEKKEFFALCWRLNKQGILTQGPSSLLVQYQLDTTELKMNAYMWFYPEFKDDKIVKMPLKFTYQSWAPWYAHTSSDSLLVDVRKMFTRWYGPFTEFTDRAGDRKVWIRIDGNRRIRLYVDNISTVNADIIDLLSQDEKEQQQ